MNFATGQARDVSDSQAIGPLESRELPTPPGPQGGAVTPPPEVGPGTGEPSYVFALGRVEPRFPSLALEKEFAQAVGRTETAGLSDRQAMHAVLAERRNRYLARQLCWVLTIEGMD